MACLHDGNELFGDVYAQAQRVRAHDGRDLGSGRDVLAHVRRPVCDVAANGRNDDGIADRFLCLLDLRFGRVGGGARRLNRGVVLPCGSELRFILLLQLIALRLLLIVSRARHVARFKQTRLAPQLLLCEFVGRARCADFRHAIRIKRLPGPQTDLFFGLSHGGLR